MNPEDLFYIKLCEAVKVANENFVVDIHVERQRFDCPFVEDNADEYKYARRSDFCIHYMELFDGEDEMRWSKVFVEIDDQEHQKTVNYERDRRIDNCLLSHAGPVIRYTNMQVLREPGRCASDALNTARFFALNMPPTRRELDYEIDVE